MASYQSIGVQLISMRVLAIRRSIRSIFCHLAIATLPLLANLPAGAVLVTVNAVEYDVTIFEGSYDDNNSLFYEPPVGQMPWWGDPTGMLASQFAFQVYNSLGVGSYSGLGPVFAYLYDSDSGSLSGLVQSLSDPNSQDILNPFSNESIKYAILYAPPVPPAPISVPAPLPCLGVIAAYRSSCRLRRLLLRRDDNLDQPH
jgi:hypothetical protein